MGTPGLTWYPEAHKPAALVETGAPGLLLGLLAVAAIFRSVRSDPWVLAALAGVALHSFVEFGMQVPAIAMLFAVLSAMAPDARPKSPDALHPQASPIE